MYNKLYCENLVVRISDKLCHYLYIYKLQSKFIMMTNSERNSQNKNEVPDFNWDRQLEVLLKYFFENSTLPLYYLN